MVSSLPDSAYHRRLPIVYATYAEKTLETLRIYFEIRHSESPATASRAAICKAFGVTVEEIDGRSKNRSLCRMRHIAMTIVSVTTKQSTYQIARAFHRHPTSVGDAVAQHQGMVKRLIAAIHTEEARSCARTASIKRDHNDESGKQAERVA